MKKLSVILILLMLCGCTLVAPRDNTVPPVQAPQDEPIKTPELVPEIRIKLCAVGDNLLHNTVSWDAQTSDTTFDFTKHYSRVAPLVKMHDLAFVNQEIPLGGIELGIGKYPNFNGPAEAASGLFNAGFNIINLASNHSLDRGVEGFLKSYENIKAGGFKNILGIVPKEDVGDNFVIINEQGIRVGMLSYTYGLNGRTLPEDRPNLVPLIDRNKIKKDVEAISKSCDILAVSMHWGTEYETEASEEQKELAQYLSDLGVDLIIGHHPHVVQPVDIISGKEGNKTVVIYSLGNFIAHQEKNSTMLGGMASLDIVRTESGQFEIQNVGILPLVTHFNTKAKGFSIYPIYDYSSDLAAKHRQKTKNSEFSYEYLDSLATKVFGEYRLTEIR